MLVEIDTNAKLEADPGEGVGVFAEYASGGKWHLFWACDTNQTKRECDYQVRVQSAAGKVSNVVDESGKPIAPTGGDVVLRRTIGTRNDGIRFDAPPGGVVTLEVTLDGRADNVLFFFVQDGKLNGGYEGGAFVEAGITAVTSYLSRARETVERQQLWCEVAYMMLQNKWKGTILQSQLKTDAFLNGPYVSAIYGKYDESK